MPFITNDEFLEHVEGKVGLLVVLPDEKDEKRVREMVEKVNRRLEEEGHDFRLKVVEKVEELEDEDSLMDKIPVIFMLEGEYCAGEKPKGLVKLIPLGLKEEAVEGAKALDPEVWKWLSWKLWQVKIGNPEAIDIAREELGKIEMKEADTG